MSDIVERLREPYPLCGIPAMAEAADEIERLRAENTKLREALKRTNHHLAKLVNGGGKDDDGKPIPSVWVAARQQVLGASAALNEGKEE
jgi:hypothetical protein